MADCPNKRWRKYIDPCTKDVRKVQYPCGHCPVCLKAQQQAWRVRISETLYHTKGFIYDTLTIRDSSMFYIDVRDEAEDFYLPDKAKRLLEHYNYFVPIIPKGLVSAWIKRGRELWNYDHRLDIKEGKCSRLQLKYFGCLEYGPKTSRCHLHFIFTGISHADYVKYFAKPWRKLYGFTKTHFIKQDGKSVRNVAKYISKYISKGCFESPLVLTGNLPPTFRCISHGIGEEYLSTPRMQSLFQSPICSSARACSMLSDSGEDMPENIVDLYGFIHDFTLSETQESLLTKYYDENGFCFACPRYYRAKLCQSYRKTFLHCAVQTNLYASSVLRRNTEIYRFATTLGITPRYKPESSLFEGWLFTRQGAMVYHLYCSAKKDKACLEAKRCAIELSNHYKRPLLAAKGVFTSLSI